MARSAAVGGEDHRAGWWSLERASGETLRTALERTLREAILSGALRSGVRLPASRKLAGELGVSRGVVTDAYEQLGAQGLLVIRPRSAPVVADIIRNSVAPPAEPLAPPPTYDLATWRSDVNLFPLQRWMAAAQRVTRECDWTTLDYRDHRGEGALREALADHLGRTRGVIADPQQIVVTQGSAQNLDLLLRALRARGWSRLAVEDPSHPIHREQVSASGLTLVAQPTDGEGIVVDGLAADAVLVAPAHQYPTGSVMSGERRRSLILCARATGALIVEDDNGAAFRYGHEPARALQGLAPDHVVHLGTVSNTLAPGLRLGWVVVPAMLLDEVTAQKRLVDGFSPVLEQLTLAEFLRSGEYDRHVRKAGAVYRGRRNALLAALAKHLPEFEVAGIAAGAHLLLKLSAAADDASIAQHAWKVRIRVRPLSAFYAERPRTKGLVIGYGRLHESNAARAICELAEIIRPRVGLG